VYEPTGTLDTRAVGIATETLTRHHRMCYTPIGTIMQLFGAELAPGPVVVNARIE
jgi:hypothetical protein